MDWLTAKETRDALRARSVGASELVDAAIARIERFDGAINAVVVRDFERARIAARAADEALARGERGALLGVPMTVKESFAVAGLKKTWGLPDAAHAPPDTHDAVAVARLKAAGAIILGKTNVPVMLADWQAFNPVYGVTNNPWDLSRTCGGSSGGAAAALAAGFVALELGGDLNGSLRIPAHCCGVYGHKPSRGVVPLRGGAPPGVPTLSVNADPDLVAFGPLARSADDLELALDVLAGPDEAYASAWRLDLPAQRHTRLADFRVAVLDAHPMLPVSDEVHAVQQRFVDELARAGCTIVTQQTATSLGLPDLEQMTRTFVTLMLAMMGGTMPPARYEAIATRVASTSRRTKPDDEATFDERALVASHRDWLAADRARYALLHQWRQCFTHVDVVLTPVLPVTALPHDHREMRERTLDIDGRRVDYAHLGAWMNVASTAGLPATAFPAGSGASGLPVGLQAVGPFLEDRTTITFARLASILTGGFKAPLQTGDA